MLPGEIRDYLEHLVELLSETGGVFTHRPLIEIDWLNAVGILTASLDLADGSRLEADIVTRGPDNFPQWTAYRFHYMDAERRCIFRYDSAPHHPGPHHPSHKHEGPDERVLDVPTPAIRDIVREIRDRVARHE